MCILDLIESRHDGQLLSDQNEMRSISDVTATGVLPFSSHAYKRGKIDTKLYCMSYGN